MKMVKMKFKKNIKYKRIDCESGLSLISDEEHESENHEELKEEHPNRYIENI